MQSTRTSWLGILLAALTALAAWGLAADARAQGVPVDQATDEQKAQARDHFTKAKDAFAAKRYDEALEGFRASYDIVASPNSRIMVVQVLDAMGRAGEAYTEAEAVQREAQTAATTDPKYQQTADAAAQLMQAIRPNIGMLTVQVPPGTDPTTTLTVNGRNIPQDQWETPVPVKAGTATVQLGDAPPQEVMVEGGGAASIDLAPAGPTEPVPVPVPEPEDDGGFEFKHKRTVAYIAGGVGAAGFIMFGIFGGLASSTYSDMEEQCPNKTACPPALQDDADSGSTYQTVANVSLVIGIVGIAAGAGLLVWDLVDPEEDEPSDDEPANEDDAYAGIRPQLVVGPGSLSIQGTF